MKPAALNLERYDGDTTTRIQYRTSNMDGDKISSSSILFSLIESKSLDPRFEILSVSLRAYEANECIW